MSVIDSKAETIELNPNEWRLRYELEAELVQICKMEELYWQKRGREQYYSRVAATGTLLISIKKQMGGKERIEFLSRKMVRNLYILQKS